MKRYLLTILISVGLGFNILAQLPMQGWQLHTAYNNVTRVEDAGDKIFALSEGALFSVDKTDETIAYYNRLTGLNSTDIADIKYDPVRSILLIAYKNGYIDLMQGNEIINIPDLYNTQLSISKEVNQITIHKQHAYLAMDFGIMVVNLQRSEIADTYYIGPNAQAVEVIAITIVGDSIFAATTTNIYAASLQDNLVDYSCWKTQPVPASILIKQLVKHNNQLAILSDSTLMVRQEGNWIAPLSQHKFYLLKETGGRFVGLTPDATYIIHSDYTTESFSLYVGAPDVLFDMQTNTYWYAYYQEGVGYWKLQEQKLNNFLPSGPLTNTAYRMRFRDENLYVVPGGYLGVYDNRAGAAMKYTEGTWLNFTQEYMMQHLDLYTQDYCDIIADPTDPSHFFVASFGYGLIEFKDDIFHARYMPNNSGIESMIPDNPEKYTWVDAFTYDQGGNLWMMNINATQNNIKILTPTGEWHSIRNTACTFSNRIKDLLIHPTKQNMKIVIGTYLEPGIGIFDDRGTLTNQTDDRAAHHLNFVDDDNNTIIPEVLPCAAFDQVGALWVGTQSGVLKFPNIESLFTSNACTRIKIAREDGSGLADYLLDNEQINAIAVDGANRIWFGTEGSGAYLMDLSDPQNIVTVHHYTSDNSPLPSNSVISIAINPITGEVFFGTGGGIVSYQSDAAEGKEDYLSAYAYPNPVRADFDGVITIAGLMDNTQVRITDNGGNLVYETKSNGGLAIWDGRNGRGERVSSGVYFAMCVTADGENNTLVKILIMN